MFITFSWLVPDLFMTFSSFADYLLFHFSQLDQALFMTLQSSELTKTMKLNRLTGLSLTQLSPAYLNLFRSKVVTKAFLSNAHFYFPIWRARVKSCGRELMFVSRYLLDRAMTDPQNCWVFFLAELRNYKQFFNLNDCLDGILFKAVFPVNDILCLLSWLPK